MTITIQDKIQQFSKRIFGSIEAQSELKKQALIEKYKVEIEKHTAEIAARKKEILDSAVTRAERERVRIIAQERNDESHMLMSIKQRVLQETLEKMRGYAREFTDSPEYRSYMKSNMLNMLQSLKESRKINIYAMEKDMELCRQLLQQEGQDYLKNGNCEILKALRDIVGGFIAEDTENLIQLDFTLVALIDENKDTVGAAITRKFNEVSSL